MGMTISLWKLTIKKLLSYEGYGGDSRRFLRPLRVIKFFFFLFVVD